MCGRLANRTCGEGSLSHIFLWKKDSSEALMSEQKERAGGRRLWQRMLKKWG
jgi:hypothetical protein